MTHVRLYADNTRRAVVISYDPVQGDTVDIRAENTATGDVGTRRAFNTGIAVLSYPASFVGEDEVTVTGSDGGESTGTIQIGDTPDVLIP